MNKVQLIAYLRQSCLVQSPSVGADPLFLALTDEELEATLDVAISKESPNSSIDNLENNNVYPVILTSKMELYYILAMQSAPLYDIDLGTNDPELKKSQRFDHYMKLVNMTRGEYASFKDLNTVLSSSNGNVGDAILNSRYYSMRNYNLATPPTANLNADLVTNNKVDLSWSVSGIVNFYSYVLYKSKSPIVDLYTTDKIESSAEKVVEFKFLHETMYRIENLEANTLYYVALVVQEKNGLKGYSEISFTTQVE